MNSAEQNTSQTNNPPPRTSYRVKIVAAILTILSLGLFTYLIFSVGPEVLLTNIGHFGFAGFATIVAIHFIRILLRSFAWKLSVLEPYSLRLKDTISAVLIGEAMSSIIPLGILISGTAKAVAVRHRIPLVAGLSSVATENLFYSFTTSIFLILGSVTFLRTFDLDVNTKLTIDLLIAAIAVMAIFLVVMVIRQWHFASETCEWLYRRGILKRFLEHGRLQVRLFENMIYGFYRRHPKRFIPICLIESAFHLLGIFEVYFILDRIVSMQSTVLAAFLLESISRLITIIFKLIPFVIGIDEAGAQFVAETLGITAGVGISLALIRKARLLFWAAVGLLIILKRGLTFKEISDAAQEQSVRP